MEQSAFWASYLAPQLGARTLQAQHALCAKAFAGHRREISHLIEALSPRTVAILGAGYLNDVPFKELVEADRQVYLVDWLGDLMRAGVARAAIDRDDRNQYHCLFCDKRVGPLYCRQFTGQFMDEAARVCTGFELVESPVVTCRRYEPSVEPRVIRADITGGVARSFATSIERRIGAWATASDAFAGAIAEVDAFERERLPIEDDSVDLVTSSMVISQFDVEPYTYFSHLLERRFGREALLRDEAALTPLMEALRTRLFMLQVESHVKEMHRIVRKDSAPRAYVSAELFRSCGEEHSDQNCFFLVQDMPKAMEILSRYFFFAFDDAAAGAMLRRVDVDQSASIDQCYRLVPRPFVAAAPPRLSPL